MQLCSDLEVEAKLLFFFKFTVRICKYLMERAED